MKRNIQNFTGYSIIILSFLVSLMLSCKKNNSGLPTPGSSPYYMRFKANGIQKNYLVAMTQSSYHDSLKLISNKTYSFEIGAANNYIETINLVVYNDSFVVSNNYKESDLLFGYQPRVILAYQVPGNLGYISCGIYYDQQIFPRYNKNCSITITSLTKTEVKGVFSGTLYQLNNTAFPALKDSVQITSGEFYMPVK